jgi:hypothetical protein
VRAFSQISAPSRNLLKTGVPFEWTKKCKTTFKRLKRALITALVLRLQRYCEISIITCDASYKGIACILGKRDDDVNERASASGVRGLGLDAKKWLIRRIERLTVVEDVK